MHSETPLERLIRRQYAAEEAERRIRELRAHRRCVDCAVDTIAIGEFYMLGDSTWPQIGHGVELAGLLCIGCVEKRIGRELRQADFTSCPINIANRTAGSARLRDRMGRGPPARPIIRALEKNLMATTEPDLRARLLAAIAEIKTRTQTASRAAASLVNRNKKGMRP